MRIVYLDPSNLLIAFPTGEMSNRIEALLCSLDENLKFNHFQVRLLPTRALDPQQNASAIASRAQYQALREEDFTTCAVRSGQNNK